MRGAIDLPFVNRDLITLQDYSNDDIMKVLKTAKTMIPIATRKKRSKILEDWILATIFFEPSTRTRMSFTSAMFRLGGKVLHMGNIAQSSVANKG